LLRGSADWPPAARSHKETGLLVTTIGPATVGYGRRLPLPPLWLLLLLRCCSCSAPRPRPRPRAWMALRPGKQRLHPEKQNIALRVSGTART